MGKGVSMDNLNGPPPVVFGMYVLRPSENRDERHLESRKDYLLRLATWSSLTPPTPGVLQKMGVPAVDEAKRKCGNIIASRCTSPHQSEKNCCGLGIQKMMRESFQRGVARAKATLF